MTREEIILKINDLKGQLVAMEQKKVNNIIPQLTKEILNLIDGVGIIDADYFAPDRYYSSINGIKNLRIIKDTNAIEVKLTENIPLPVNIDINGVNYDIVVSYSKHYSSRPV